MSEQSKPRWFPPGQCWRYRVEGQTFDAPRSIGRDDEAGAWRWVAGLFGRDGRTRRE